MKAKRIIAAAAAAVLLGGMAIPASAMDRTVSAMENSTTGPVAHGAYIQGFPDGTVRPDSRLTEAEALQMLHNIDPENPAPQVFYGSPAISRGAFAERILASKSCPAEEMSQFLTGYPDGSLGLERTLTRAEAVTMLNRAYGRFADTFSIDVSADRRIMPDVTQAHWAYGELMEAVTSHTVAQDASAEGGEQWATMEPGTVSLPAGWRNIQGNLFYVTEQGLFAYGTTVNGLALDENGRYSTGNEELDGLLRPEIQKIINNDMTQDQKLRAIYDYMKKNYGYRSAGIVENGSTGWEAEYAAEMLKNGKGNCYSWAAAFSFLARQSGEDARAVAGTAVSPKGSVRDHAWTEVRRDGRVYICDPEIEAVYGQNAGETYDLFMKEYGMTESWSYNQPEDGRPGDGEGTGQEPGQTDEVDAALLALLDSIYKDAGMELRMPMNAAIGADNENYYLGVSGLSYEAGVGRESMIMPTAHSCVLLKMAPGTDMAKAAAEIKANVDGSKWICVGVAEENILTGYTGSYLFLAMDNSAAQDLMKSFQKICGGAAA